MAALMRILFIVDIEADDGTTRQLRKSGELAGLRTPKG